MIMIKELFSAFYLKLYMYLRTYEKIENGLNIQFIFILNKSYGQNDNNDKLNSKPNGTCSLFSSVFALWP